MKRISLACLFALLLVPAVVADGPTVLIPDRDAIEITGDAVLEPGTWTVADRDGMGVLRITTDGVTLDLGGATLRGAPADTAPDTLTGVGILVVGAKDVTIRNGNVAGFKLGIRAVDAPGLEIVSVDASGNFKQRLKSTPEKEDASDWLWPHHNDEGEWETRYGAGISLNDCRGAAVRDCTVRHGQNGLLLTRCRGCGVSANDFSFNSGWGVALYRTSHSLIGHNQLDFCVRGYSHGVYFRGQDSAAILVFEQSSHNTFFENSATHSGDGFFLYAGHETTQKTGQGGSNENSVLGNDFRFAVANGIEATFSCENRFLGNDCSCCDHGIWAGYSRESTFSMNVMHDCRTAGISIEHGHHNRISENDIQGARYGVHLWWDEDEAFLQGPFGQNQDCSSSRNIIAMNRLSGTVAALRLWGDTGSTVNDNAFPADHSRMELGPGTLLGALKGNGFRHLTIVNRTGSPFVLGDDNGVRDGISHEGDPTSFAGEIRSGWRPPLRLESLLTLGPPPRIAYPLDMPAGRDQIRIGEWGPIDPRETRLFPAEQSAAGDVAKIHLLGSKAFEVIETSDGVEVVPSEGTAPATLAVRAKGSNAAILPFRVVVASDGQRLEASGTLLRMPWEVSWYRWTAAEDPMTKPEAFAALLAGEPVRRVEVPSLDFPWQGAGPKGVGGDGFATTATSTVTLPAGRYRARVVSDDGVRLFVDGKMVVERWDRHGPTEDVAALDLAAGEHTFRLVHFEIDGWAWLAFRLEPVTE